MLKERDGRYYLVFKNARIMFRNFEGRERKNNRAGDRNFCVRIDDPEEAQQLAADGWNVKTLGPRDGEEDEVHFIQVRLNYNGRAPKILVRTANNELYYDEDTVKNLDAAELANIRIVINPYHWEVNGKKGIKAYLNSFSADLVDESFFFDDDEGDDLPFDV